MKSLKQIADEIGVDKQRVYRFVKREALHEALQENGVMLYDEAVETRIKSEFSKSEVHREALHDAVNEAVEAHHEAGDESLVTRCEMLEKRVDELEDLNQWLRDQVDQMSAQNSMLVQSLAATTVAEAKKQQLVLPDPSKRKWWQFWK